MSLEELLKKLNEIKLKLEQDEISLDESVKLYEESVDYTKKCMDILSETEGKILKIKNELDKMVEKPLDIEEE